MRAIIILFLSTLCIFAQVGLDQATLGLNVRVLGSSANTGNDDNQSTSSYTVAQETELIAIVINTKAATPDQPTLVGNGLTWTEVFDTNYISTHRLTIWYAKSSSGAFEGTLTAATTGVSQTGWALAVVEVSGTVITGLNGVNAIKQTVNANVSAGTTITATFATLGKRTLCLGLLAANLNGTAMTAESGWTELVDVNYNTPATELTIVAQLKNADTTCAISNAGAFTGCIFGIELVQLGNWP